MSKCKMMKRNRSHHSNIFWKVTTVYPCNMSWRDTKQVKTVFNNEEDTFGELCAGIPKYSNPCDFWLVQNRKWNYQVLYHLFGVMKPISDDTFMFWCSFLLAWRYELQSVKIRPLRTVSHHFLPFYLREKEIWRPS